MRSLSQFKKACQAKAMKPIEKVTCWRDPGLEGLEICQVDGSRHVFPDHAHNGIYAIGMMKSRWCRLGRSP